MSMPSQTRTDAGLSTALRVSVARLARRLRAQRADSSLSATQIGVLGAIEKHGPMSPGELADHEKVKPPSMTRVIAGLEERDLIQRAAHPTDRRQVVLAITPMGKQTLRETRRMREAWLVQRLKELTPEEKATLRAAAPILEKISQA